MLTLILSLLLATSLCAAADYGLNPITVVREYELEGENREYQMFGGSMAKGDYDGNGIEEFAISAWFWNTSVGKICFYQYENDWPIGRYLEIDGCEGRKDYGIEIETLGDVNGDGLVDLGALCRAPLIDIYFGSENFDEVIDFTIEPPNIYGKVRWLSSAGDVNGDGWDDFMVEVLHEKFSDPWVTEIYHGGPGLDDVPDWTALSRNAFGMHGLSGLGDINGDGYDDILMVGRTPTSTNPFIPPHIFFGGSPMDTLPDLILYDYAHYGAAGVGDVNGDGYNDFSLNMKFPDELNSRRVVYFGGPEVDDVPDVYLLNLDGERYGGYPICSGDFNGDGYSDIAIRGFYGESPAITNVVHIYLGSPDFNHVPDAADGELEIFKYGTTLCAVDVNADGRDELLVTVLNRPGFDIGRVYLYIGPQEWTDYGASPVAPEPARGPADYHFLGNYPNPFNASTTITFELSDPSLMSLAIYDLQGRLIRELINSEVMGPGSYSFDWSGKDARKQSVASGIYILELQINDFKEVRKMILMR